MSRKYNAIIHGDRVEWIDSPPDDEPMRVEIIVLDGESSESQPSNGQKMAEILDTLASQGAFSEIEDLVEWQRDQRHERNLPER